MEISTTQHIAQALIRQIVEHRLKPGAKLVEQKLADQFSVSRTLVRQALYQLAKQHLVVMEPSRGAFVSAPSIEEAGQVFEVRRMLEAQMTQHFAEQATPEHIRSLQDHVQQERAAIERGDAPGRVELLGDFHVRMAELLGNHVLADLLSDLISRCALITLMYQSSQDAQVSNEEHQRIVQALAYGDAKQAVREMDDHLQQVFAGLRLGHQQPGTTKAAASAA